MAHSNSPLGQLVGVVPATIDSPDVQGDLVLLITAAEKRVNLTFTTRAARDAAFTAASQTPVDGMQAYYTAAPDAGEIDQRIAGVWKKIYPLIYSGTGTPSNSLGVNGDVYFQTT
jgi:hypothetical protein